MGRIPAAGIQRTDQRNHSGNSFRLTPSPAELQKTERERRRRRRMPVPFGCRKI